LFFIVGRVWERSRDVLCCSERTYVVYGNIMYDRRVIRGNTYAQAVIPTVRSLSVS